MCCSGTRVVLLFDFVAMWCLRLLCELWIPSPHLCQYMGLQGVHHTESLLLRCFTYGSLLLYPRNIQIINYRQESALTEIMRCSGGETPPHFPPLFLPACIFKKKTPQETPSLPPHPPPFLNCLYQFITPSPFNSNLAQHSPKFPKIYMLPLTFLFPSLPPPPLLSPPVTP